MLLRRRMGIYDRDYSREDRRRAGGFFSPHLTPVVKTLLGINIAVFLFDELFRGADSYRILREFGIFNIHAAIFEFQIWRWITFQFLHAGLAHLLFNCLALYSLGPWMERWWGSRMFAVFYLLCGAAGAVLYSLLVFIHLLPNDQAGLLGASAGIYGILIGIAKIAPDLRVRLMLPPVELSMRQLAIGLIAISAVMLIFNFNDNRGGEIGHLGGTLLGYLLVTFPHLLGKRNARSHSYPTRKRPPPQPKLRPRSELEKQQDSEVDLILDKISSHGFQSLTQAERDFLNKVSQSKYPNS